ncbi:MAG: sulfite exporter TauE/SafE family protein [Saprospiraceae bacterium]|nr:sulfite exporter TauE/SafE family protein [Saprospiraceae bacterium]
MFYIAFTLGLFGSLHCLGMCGPLALAFCDNEQDNVPQRLMSGLSYNLGRTFTYAVIGLFFGLLGSFLVVVDLQKILSVVLGVLLVISFLLSFDIDQKINGITSVQKLYNGIRQSIARMYSKAKQYHPFVLGAANGLLPCGLVYLALAGAIASGTLTNGMFFMAFFGLGTIPMMLALVLGFKFINPKIRFQFRKVLPYVTLFFGLFLIYRGVMVDMPNELNFWEMLKNPVMCH